MKKEKKKHIYLFLSASLIYVFFIVRGLHNNHYLDWHADFRISDCFSIMIFMLPMACFLLKVISEKQNYLKDSFWLAFYTSIPFIIFDLLYVGLVRGHGLIIFGKFWNLTIFYFIVWIEVPITGYLMQKDDPKLEKKHLTMIMVVIIAWLLNFWEGMYSNHYLDWSLNMKIVRLTNISLILPPITYFVLRFQSDKDGYFKDSVLLTLYFSSIFILFDFLFLAISKGHGINFIFEFWFVTLFYVIFWLEIPFIGWIMQNFKMLKKVN
ncbi:hypothetical protein KKA14_00570 [bacterium]|nr:hypothetical protein [bacterium]